MDREVEGTDWRWEEARGSVNLLGVLFFQRDISASSLWQLPAATRWRDTAKGKTLDRAERKSHKKKKKTERELTCGRWSYQDVWQNTAKSFYWQIICACSDGVERGAWLQFASSPGHLLSGKVHLGITFKSKRWKEIQQLCKNIHLRRVLNVTGKKTVMKVFLVSVCLFLNTSSLFNHFSPFLEQTWLWFAKIFIFAHSLL